MKKIYANTTVSVSELRKAPMAVVEGSQGDAVAILNRNEPVAYLVPASAVHRNEPVDLNDSDMDSLISTVVEENTEALNGLRTR